MMHHSRQCASFGLVLFWVILTPEVITAVDVGGVYDCNPPWSNSDTVKITFRIDRSQYPLKCAPGTTAGKPVFQTSPDGNVTYGANCTVTTDIRTSCPFISGTIGCGCTNSNDNSFYVVEYNFIFGPDYHRYWEAEIACLDGNFSKSISFKNNGLNCKPVAQPTPTTTAPPTPCSLCVCREGCEGECVGCICIIIGAVIIILTCVYCLLYRRCCGPSSGWCCLSEKFTCTDRCLKACHCGRCIPEDKPKPTCPPAKNDGPDDKEDGTCPPAKNDGPDDKEDGTCPPAKNDGPDDKEDGTCPPAKNDGPDDKHDGDSVSTVTGSTEFDSGETQEAEEQQTIV